MKLAFEGMCWLPPVLHLEDGKQRWVNNSRESHMALSGKCVAHSFDACVGSLETLVSMASSRLGVQPPAGCLELSEHCCTECRQVFARQL